MNWALFTFAKQRESVQNPWLVSGMGWAFRRWLPLLSFRPWVGHGANPPFPYMWTKSAERAREDLSSAKRTFPGCLLGSEECLLFPLTSAGPLAQSLVVLWLQLSWWNVDKVMEWMETARTAGLCSEGHSDRMRDKGQRVECGKFRLHIKDRKCFSTRKWDKHWEKIYPGKLLSSCCNSTLQGLSWCTAHAHRIFQLSLSEVSTRNRDFCCH